MRLNKKNSAVFIIFFFTLLVFLGLNYSSRFNDFVFSKVINPYDPLSVKKAGADLVNSGEQEYWEDPRGLFPILAYGLPDSTKNLTTTLRIIDRDGINLVINANKSWANDANKVKDAFNKLGDFNFRWIAIVEDECKDNFIFENWNDQTNGNIRSTLKMFDDKYVYGWELWDEPGRNRRPCSPLNLIPNDDIADINKMSAQIQSDSSFNKKLDFVNLFPIYWEGTPDTAAYAKYIDSFVNSQEFKPRVLCYDYYPFLKQEFGGFRKSYYSNLDIMRRKSIQYNIPFWILVLSSEHLNYKEPTIQEISFQVYSALAYGAKGIGYYLYSKSWIKFGYKSWILENDVEMDTVADSLHGPLYLPVKNLNQDIQTLGKILLGLKCIEVIHSSDYPHMQEDITNSILKNAKSDSLIDEIVNLNEPNKDPRVLIGILKERKYSAYNKVTYLMVVNKDVTTEANVNIILRRMVDIYKFNKNNGEKTFVQQSDTLNTNISPGSGELFFIEPY